MKDFRDLSVFYRQDYGDI